MLIGVVLEKLVEKIVINRKLASAQDGHPRSLRLCRILYGGLCCWSAAGQRIRHSPGFGIASQVVRRQLFDGSFRSELADHVPTTFSVILSPQTRPALFTRRNTLPEKSLIF